MKKRKKLILSRGSIVCLRLSTFGSSAMIHPQEIEEVKSELKTAENDMELRQNEQGTSRMQ